MVHGHGGDGHADDVVPERPFQRRGFLTGSFRYDASTGGDSDSAIVTTPGGAYQGAVYDDFEDLNPAPGELGRNLLAVGAGLLDQTPTGLYLAFIPSLSAAGGVRPLLFSQNFEGPCTEEPASGLDCFLTQSRYLLSGTATAATPVSEPGTAWLLAVSGLLAWLAAGRTGYVV